MNPIVSYYNDLLSEPRGQEHFQGRKRYNESPAFLTPQVIQLPSQRNTQIRHLLAAARQCEINRNSLLYHGNDIQTRVHLTLHPHVYSYCSNA